MEHEDIIKAFVDRKAVDFEVVGGLVAKLGPQVAIDGLGHHFILTNQRFILACFLTADDLAQGVELEEVVGLERAVLGR